MRALVRAGVVHVVVREAAGYRLAAGTDAILGPDTTGLDSEHGWASHVRRTAGPQVGEELAAQLAGKRRLELGGIIATGPGKLSCRRILHAAVLDGGERIQPEAFAAAVSLAIAMALDNGWSTLDVLVPEAGTGQRRRQIIEELAQARTGAVPAHGRHLMVRFIVAPSAFADELRAGLEAWTVADVETRAGQEPGTRSSTAPGSASGTGTNPGKKRGTGLTQGEQDALVEHLEKCAAIRDGGTRKLVVARLPEHIAVRIDELPGLRAHVTEMVKKCASYPGGLSQLRSAVYRFEGGSFAMQELDALLARTLAHRD